LKKYKAHGFEKISNCWQTSLSNKYFAVNYTSTKNSQKLNQKHQYYIFETLAGECFFDSHRT